MEALFLILANTFLVSAIAFVGIATLVIKEELLKKILLILVALSAGTLMGGAFLHLIPEAIGGFTNYNTFLFILLGFIVFFAVEKLLHWRHCHVQKCPVHVFAYTNLLGDSIHNFIDGLIIAASFLASFELGATTTLAVALHEIPQEIGDFGVLVYAGFKRIKALILNFVCALIAVFGGLFGYFLYSFTETSVSFLLPFAAGGFVYIAASDLIPEIREERSLKRSLVSFLVFLLGIGIMLAIKT